MIYLCLIAASLLATFVSSDKGFESSRYTSVLFCFVNFLYWPKIFFLLFLLVGGQLLYNIVVVFVIHWQESAMDLHVFPIPIPPPITLSDQSLWVFPVHQPRALVSCIQPGLEICFTLDNIDQRFYQIKLILIIFLGLQKYLLFIPPFSCNIFAGLSHFSMCIGQVTRFL